MLNHIWAFLIAAGILVGMAGALRKAQMGETVTTTVDGKEVKELRPYKTMLEKAQAVGEAGSRLTKDTINAASFRYTDPATGKEKQGAVGIAIDYVGIMALWLGFMKIAEASGLIQLLARAIAPLFRFIFPRVPVDHPAAGAILMNYAANMLGLDNAATPLGIKAMKELQELNAEKDTASNAMCMFLALNVSSLTLLPVSVIGFRVANHSEQPTAFMVPMLIATACGTSAAFIACKLVERFSRDTRSTLDAPAGEVR